MAHIGMKVTVAAPWQEGNTDGDGVGVAKAVNFIGTSNKSEVGR